jgi:hypothetical protein
MSLLLVGIEPGLGEPLIAHLIAQEDEVRVVEEDSVRAAHWKELGAYVARGDGGDSDLIERAAQNVRTIVVFERAHEDLVSVVETVLEGAGWAGVERIVVCAPTVPKRVMELLRASRVEYVALATGRRRIVGGRTASESTITAAIDAADDIAGPVRLELDLNQPDALDSLGIG